MAWRKVWNLWDFKLPSSPFVELNPRWCIKQFQNGSNENNTNEKDIIKKRKIKKKKKKDDVKPTSDDNIKPSKPSSK